MTKQARRELLKAVRPRYLKANKAGKGRILQPVMKLLEKSRVGSPVRKKYDQAHTPCQRVPASPHVHPLVKEQLQSFSCPSTLSLFSVRSSPLAGKILP